MASAENYYRFETASGCLLITLLPELNDKQWADIDKVGTEITERLGSSSSPRLILDLSPLSYMGSAMVALIVRLYKAVNVRSGQMVVVNQHELVLEVLKLAGLTKLWTIVDSREKALSTLGVRGRALKGGELPAEGGTGILVAGVIGTVGAIIGLALQMSKSHQLSPKVAQLIELGFGALGIVVGTMILAKQTGVRRNIGIVFLVICVLVILGGIIVAPERNAAPAAPASVETSTSVPAKAEIPAAMAVTQPSGNEFRPLPPAVNPSPVNPSPVNPSPVNPSPVTPASGTEAMTGPPKSAPSPSAAGTAGAATAGASTTNGGGFGGGLSPSTTNPPTAGPLPNLSDRSNKRNR